MKTERKETKRIKVGNIFIGGDNNIIIQSMTNTKTKNIEKTIKQIHELEKAGCQLVRVAILDMLDAKAIIELKKAIFIPIVADIHFDYKLALECIKNGIDKIRINPGNIKNEEHIKTIVKECKRKSIPIRIGVNSGSLGLEVNAENMIKRADEHIKILEDLDFYDIILSLKASNITLAIKAYRLASNKYPYPLHIGITEAGTSFSGLIRSSIGLGILINEGIGSTIRVSLTDNPVKEIFAAKEILKNFNLINGPKLISCPTCGRIEYDMIVIANEIEKYLYTVNKDITVAIMGCGVNGPGEAKEATIGIAGGKGEAILFKKGKVIRKIKEEFIIEELKKEIELL